MLHQYMLQMAGMTPGSETGSIGEFLLNQVMVGVRKHKRDQTSDIIDISTPIEPKLLAVVEAVTARSGLTPARPRSRTQSQSARSTSAAATNDSDASVQSIVRLCAMKWLKWLRSRLVQSSRHPLYEMSLSMMKGIRVATANTNAVADSLPSQAAWVHSTAPATQQNVRSSAANIPAAISIPNPASVPVATAVQLSDGVTFVRSILPVTAAPSASGSGHIRPPAAAAAASSNGRHTPPTSPGPTLANAFAGSTLPFSPSIASSTAAAIVTATNPSPPPPNSHNVNGARVSLSSPLSEAAARAVADLFNPSATGADGHSSDRSLRESALPTLATALGSNVSARARTCASARCTGGGSGSERESAQPLYNRHPLLSSLEPSDFRTVHRFSIPRDPDCIRMEVCWTRKQRRLRLAQQRENEERLRQLQQTQQSNGAAPAGTVKPHRTYVERERDAARPGGTRSQQSPSMPPSLPVSAPSLDITANDAKMIPAPTASTAVPIPVLSRKKSDPFRDESCADRLAREQREATAENVSIAYDFEEFAPRVFANVRRHCGVSDRAYLDGSNASDGGGVANVTHPLRSFKSFSKGSDRTYLMKSLTSTEFEFFLNLLRAVYTHWIAYPYSLLGKVLGLYRVQARNVRHYFMVLPNAFRAPSPIHPISVIASNSAPASSLHCHYCRAQPGACQCESYAYGLWKKFDLKGSSIDRICSKKELCLLSPLLKDNDFGSIQLRFGPDVETSAAASDGTTATATATATASTNSNASGSGRCNNSSADVKSAPLADPYSVSAPPVRAVLPVLPRSLLIDQLAADVAFLESHNIMDYSLLCGIFRPLHPTERTRSRPPDASPDSESVRSPASDAKCGTVPTHGLMYHAGAAGHAPHFTGEVSRPSENAASSPDSKSADARADSSAEALLWSRPYFLVSAADVHEAAGASDTNGELYSLAIIDFLQPYNMAKKMESLLKGIFVDRSKLSSVDAGTYAKRFTAFVEQHISSYAC